MSSSESDHNHHPQPHRRSTKAKRRRRISSSDSDSDSDASQEESVALVPASMAAVPINTAGKTTVRLAIVAEAPSETSQGTGWLIESARDIDPGATQCALYISNTHVGLKGAYSCGHGLEHCLEGLYWETESPHPGARSILPITPQYRDYLSQVRHHGIAAAAPHACTAALNTLARGTAPSKAHTNTIISILSTDTPVREPTPTTAVCYACRAVKSCTHSIAGHPLGSDCAKVLKDAQPACRLLKTLQSSTRLPYPHTFQFALQDLVHGFESVDPP